MRQDNQNVKVINGVEIKGANGQALNAIPWRATAVVKSDSTVFPMGILYVGVGGDVVVMPAGQTTSVTLKGVPAGSFVPLYITMVLTATTATDMLICY